MKKSQFKGIDRMIVEQYKAPIERFNGHEDFQNFCKSLVKEITKYDYLGRRAETQAQRKGMLKEWFEYVTKENDAYTDSIALMILKAVTKNLKKDDDTLPPVLNKGILAGTVEDVQKELTDGSKQNVDFYKAYMNNMQKDVTDDYGLSENQTGWVIIPSRKHNYKNFEQNVKKLQTLSHPNWCTKGFNAEPYLSEGDFHVYIEDGKPQLGVRFVRNKIEEIQGPNNDGTIPVRYFKFISYFKKYRLSNKARNEICKLAKFKSKIRLKFPKGIENYSTEELLRKCGIKCRRDFDGMLIISELKSPYKNVSFGDMGISLNKLLKEVKEIEGDADFEGANSFGNVRVVGGYADIHRTDITDLGKLEYAGKGLGYNKKQKEMAAEFKPRIINYIHQNFFPKGVENYSTQEILETFGIKCKKDSDGMLIISEYHQPLDSYRGYLTYSELGIDENKLLHDIKKIEGCAHMQGSKATSLGNVREIKDALNLNDSDIKDISSLDFAGWFINAWAETNITKEDIEKAQMRTMEYFKKKYFPKGVENYSTKEILETFGFKCRKILFGKNRGKLVLSKYKSPKNPNLNLAIMGIDENKLFEDIVRIKKFANFSYTNVTDTGALERIGDDLIITCDMSPIKTPNLKYVGGNIKIKDPELLELDGVKIKGKIVLR